MNKHKLCVLKETNADLCECHEWDGRKACPCDFPVLYVKTPVADDLLRFSEEGELTDNLGDSLVAQLRERCEEGRLYEWELDYEITKEDEYFDPSDIWPNDIVPRLVGRPVEVKGWQRGDEVRISANRGHDYS